jgi:hypothetical protein
MSYWMSAAVALLVCNLVIDDTAGAAPLYGRAVPSMATDTCLRLTQFDTDDDGVAGCTNQCRLDLEICLNTRPEGESRDRCEKLEDTCENGCYDTGPAKNSNE